MVRPAWTRANEQANRPTQKKSTPLNASTSPPLKNERVRDKERMGYFVCEAFMVGSTFCSDIRERGEEGKLRC
jgi:hypothetical protein